ncbi:MAG: LapA family protein [Tissierellia bacterium]|jgi:uncharacterized integral membrane protein|nr:LapA family protein [Tissierellia bacterium]
MQSGFIFSLIFAVFIGLFALRNGGPVTIDLFFTEIAMSQALVIIFSALLGALVIYLLNFFKILHFKREIKTLNKKSESVDSDIQVLNNKILILEEEKNGLLKVIEEKEAQVNTLVDINTELPPNQNN